MIAATYWPSLRSAQGQRFRTSWDALCRKLSTPRVAADKHDVPGLSLATFLGDRRALANVERVYAVGLDFDQDLDWDALCHAFGDTAAFLHTTWQSTPAAPRARAFVLLSRPVTGPEYRVLYAHVAGILAGSGFVVDRAASDPSRLWFLPCIPPGGTYLHRVCGWRPMRVADEIPIPPPEAPPSPPPPSGPVGDVEARAEKYLDRCDPAISGQGGHRTTFLVAQRLVRGFLLDEPTAYRLLARWNERCQPPWSEKELRRKLAQAARHGRMAEGDLRDRPRRAS